MRRRNYARRGGGLLIACTPVALLVGSLVRAATHPSASTTSDTAGLAVVMLASVVAALNFYVSFVRPALYSRKNGSADGYARVSPVPVVGTLGIVIGTLLGFGSATCAILGLLALAVDTGGLPWFLILTWKDEGFWDR